MATWLGARVDVVSSQALSCCALPGDAVEARLPVRSTIYSSIDELWSKCDADNPAHYKHCGQCGARLEGKERNGASGQLQNVADREVSLVKLDDEIGFIALNCDKCGADNPAHYEHCGQCGARLEGKDGTVTLVSFRNVADREVSLVKLDDEIGFIARLFYEGPACLLAIYWVIGVLNAMSTAFGDPAHFEEWHRHQHLPEAFFNVLMLFAFAKVIRKKKATLAIVVCSIWFAANGIIVLASGEPDAQPELLLAFVAFIALSFVPAIWGIAKVRRYRTLPNSGELSQ